MNEQNTLFSEKLRRGIAGFLCVWFPLTQFLTAGSAWAANSLAMPTTPLVTTVGGVRPNVIFMLDDSTSMGSDYLPDHVYFSTKIDSTNTLTRFGACYDSGETPITASTGWIPGDVSGNPSQCKIGDPPRSAADFNQVYYNPSVTYTPPSYSNGSSYAAQTTPGSVATDPFEQQQKDQLGNAVTSVDINQYPDHVWCVSPDSDVTSTACRRNTHTYPDAKFKYGYSYVSGGTPTYKPKLNSSGDQAWCVSPSSDPNDTLACRYNQRAFPYTNTGAGLVNAYGWPLYCLSATSDPTSAACSISRSEVLYTYPNATYTYGFDASGNPKLGTKGDQVWCLAPGDDVTDAARCASNGLIDSLGNTTVTHYRFPNAEFRYGIQYSGADKYTLGNPYYYSIVPTIYCDNVELKNKKVDSLGAVTYHCSSQLQPDATFKYPALVQWCNYSLSAGDDSSTIINSKVAGFGDCQGKRIGTYVYPRFLGYLDPKALNVGYAVFQMGTLIVGEQLTSLKIGSSGPDLLGGTPITVDTTDVATIAQRIAAAINGRSTSGGLTSVPADGGGSVPLPAGPGTSWTFIACAGHNASNTYSCSKAPFYEYISQPSLIPEGNIYIFPAQYTGLPPIPYGPSSAKPYTIDTGTYPNFASLVTTGPNPSITFEIPVTSTDQPMEINDFSIDGVSFITSANPIWSNTALNSDANVSSFVTGAAGANYGGSNTSLCSAIVSALSASSLSGRFSVVCSGKTIRITDTSASPTNINTLVSLTHLYLNKISNTTLASEFTAPSVSGSTGDTFVLPRVMVKVGATTLDALGTGGVLFTTGETASVVASRIVTAINGAGTSVRATISDTDTSKVILYSAALPPVQVQPDTTSGTAIKYLPKYCRLKAPGTYSGDPTYSSSPTPSNVWDFSPLTISSFNVKLGNGSESASAIASMSSTNVLAHPVAVDVGVTPQTVVDAVAKGGELASGFGYNASAPAAGTGAGLAEVGSTNAKLGVLYCDTNALGGDNGINSGSDNQNLSNTYGIIQSNGMNSSIPVDATLTSLQAGVGAMGTSASSYAVTGYEQKTFLNGAPGITLLGGASDTNPTQTADTAASITTKIYNAILASVGTHGLSAYKDAANNKVYVFKKGYRVYAISKTISDSYVTMTPSATVSDAGPAYFTSVSMNSKYEGPENYGGTPASTVASGNLLNGIIGFDASTSSNATTKGTIANIATQLSAKLNTNTSSFSAVKGRGSDNKVYIWKPTANVSSPAFKLHDAWASIDFGTTSLPYGVARVSSLTVPYTLSGSAATSSNLIAATDFTRGTVASSIKSSLVSAIESAATTCNTKGAFHSRVPLSDSGTGTKLYIYHLGSSDSEFCDVTAPSSSNIGKNDNYMYLTMGTNFYPTPTWMSAIYFNRTPYGGTATFDALTFSSTAYAYPVNSSSGAINYTSGGLYSSPALGSDFATSIATSVNGTSGGAYYAYADSANRVVYLSRLGSNISPFAITWGSQYASLVPAANSDSGSTSTAIYPVDVKVTAITLPSSVNVAGSGILLSAGDSKFTVGKKIQAGVEASGTGYHAAYALDSTVYIYKQGVAAAVSAYTTDTNYISTTFSSAISSFGGQRLGSVKIVSDQGTFNFGDFDIPPGTSINDSATNFSSFIKNNLTNAFTAIDVGSSTGRVDIGKTGNKISSLSFTVTDQYAYFKAPSVPATAPFVGYLSSVRVQLADTSWVELLAPVAGVVPTANYVQLAIGSSSTDNATKIKNAINSLNGLGYVAIASGDTVYIYKYGTNLISASFTQADKYTTLIPNVPSGVSSIFAITASGANATGGGVFSNIDLMSPATVLPSSGSYSTSTPCTTIAEDIKKTINASINAATYDISAVRSGCNVYISRPYFNVNSADVKVNTKFEKFWVPDMGPAPARIDDVYVDGVSILATKPIYEVAFRSGSAVVDDLITKINTASFSGFKQTATGGAYLFVAKVPASDVTSGGSSVASKYGLITPDVFGAQNSGYIQVQTITNNGGTNIFSAARNNASVLPGTWTASAQASAYQSAILSGYTSGVLASPARAYYYDGTYTNPTSLILLDGLGGNANQYVTLTVSGFDGYAPAKISSVCINGGSCPAGDYTASAQALGSAVSFSGGGSTSAVSTSIKTASAVAAAVASNINSKGSYLAVVSATCTTSSTTCDLYISKLGTNLSSVDATVSTGFTSLLASAVDQRGQARVSQIMLGSQDLLAGAVVNFTPGTVDISAATVANSLAGAIAAKSGSNGGYTAYVDPANSNKVIIHSTSGASISSAISSVNIVSKFAGLTLYAATTAPAYVTGVFPTTTDSASNGKNLLLPLAGCTSGCYNFTLSIPADATTSTSYTADAAASLLLSKVKVLDGSYTSSPWGYRPYIKSTETNNVYFSLLGADVTAMSATSVGSYAKLSLTANDNKGYFHVDSVSADAVDLFSGSKLAVAANRTAAQVGSDFATRIGTSAPSATTGYAAKCCVTTTPGVDLIVYQASSSVSSLSGSPLTVSAPSNPILKVTYSGVSSDAPAYVTDFSATVSGTATQLLNSIPLALSAGLSKGGSGGVSSVVRTAVDRLGYRAVCRVSTSTSSCDADGSVYVSNSLGAVSAGSSALYDRYAKFAGTVSPNAAAYISALTVGLSPSGTSSNVLTSGVSLSAGSTQQTVADAIAANVGLNGYAAARRSSGTSAYVALWNNQSAGNPVIESLSSANLTVLDQYANLVFGDVASTSPEYVNGVSAQTVDSSGGVASFSNVMSASKTFAAGTTQASVASGVSGVVSSGFSSYLSGGSVSLSYTGRNVQNPSIDSNANYGAVAISGALSGPSSLDSLTYSPGGINVLGSSGSVLFSTSDTPSAAATKVVTAINNGGTGFAASGSGATVYIYKSDKTFPNPLTVATSGSFATVTAPSFSAFAPAYVTGLSLDGSNILSTVVSVAAGSTASLTASGVAATPVTSGFSVTAAAAAVNVLKPGATLSSISLSYIQPHALLTTSANSLAVYVSDFQIDGETVISAPFAIAANATADGAAEAVRTNLKTGFSGNRVGSTLGVYRSGSSSAPISTASINTVTGYYKTVDFGTWIGQATLNSFTIGPVTSGFSPVTVPAQTVNAFSVGTSGATMASQVAAAIGTSPSTTAVWASASGSVLTIYTPTASAADVLSGFVPPATVHPTATIAIAAPDGSSFNNTQVTNVSIVSGSSGGYSCVSPSSANLIYASTPQTGSPDAMATFIAGLDLSGDGFTLGVVGASVRVDENSSGTYTGLLNGCSLQVSLSPATSNAQISVTPFAGGAGVVQAAVESAWAGGGAASYTLTVPPEASSQSVVGSIQSSAFTYDSTTGSSASNSTNLGHSFDMSAMTPQVLHSTADPVVSFVAAAATATPGDTGTTMATPTSIDAADAMASMVAATGSSLTLTSGGTGISGNYPTVQAADSLVIEAQPAASNLTFACNGSAYYYPVNCSAATNASVAYSTQGYARSSSNPSVSTAKSVVTFSNSTGLPGSFTMTAAGSVMSLSGVSYASGNSLGSSNVTMAVNSLGTIVNVPTAGSSDYSSVRWKGTYYVNGTMASGGSSTLSSTIFNNSPAYFTSALISAWTGFVPALGTTAFSKPNVSGGQNRTLPGVFQRVDLVPCPSSDLNCYGRDITQSTVSKYSDRTDCAASNGCTYTEELTNFSNWYAYYRTRMQATKTSAGIAFAALDNSFRIGLMTIHPTDTSRPYVAVDTFSTAQKSSWFTSFYGTTVPGNSETPLRAAMSVAGRMYAGQHPLNSTDDPVQFSCQQNFLVMATDGAWYEGDEDAIKQMDGTRIGDQDHTADRPYFDGDNGSSKSCPVLDDAGVASPLCKGTATRPSCSSCASTDDAVKNYYSTSTLADVAQYYYTTDLRNSSYKYYATVGTPSFNCTATKPDDSGSYWDTCSDNVSSASTSDTSSTQHMTVFTIGMGIDGVLNYRSDYDSSSANSGDYYEIKAGTKSWPQVRFNDLTSVDDLWHAAVNGHGKYFSVRNPALLRSDLNKAFQSIAERSGLGTVGTTSNLAPETNDNFAYVASYTTRSWIGSVEARYIDLNTNTVLAQPIWCVSNNAAHVDSVTGETTTECTGKMASQIGESADSRNIYLFDSSAANKLRSFTWANLTATEKAYFDPTALNQYPYWSASVQADTTNNQKLLNYVRGQYGNEMDRSYPTANSLFRYRASAMGDIQGSRPVYIRKAYFTYTDPGYSTFASTVYSRVPTLYVGANDGMLHAFDATTSYNGSSNSPTSPAPSTGGVERWAYIPSQVVSKLSRLADNTYAGANEVYVNGGLAYGDVCVSNCTSTATADWRTIVVSGLGAGGKGYFALDVTNPTSPKALWEFSNNSDKDVGYGFGNINIFKFLDPTDSTYKWVVAVASGYNNTGTNASGQSGDGKGYVYLLNPLTGAVIRKIATGHGGTGAGTSGPSGLSKLAAFSKSGTPYINNTVRYMYGGDLNGYLYRFDLEKESGTSGEVVELARLTDASGNAQPITVRPELSTVTGVSGATSVTKRVILLGTGKYLEAADLNTTGTQTIYGIFDSDDLTNSNTLTDIHSLWNSSSPTTSTMVKQTLTAPAFVVSGGVTTTTIRRGLADCPGSTGTCSVNPVTQRGWFVDLGVSATSSGTEYGFDNTGERVVNEPSLVSGVLVMPSVVPRSNTVCAPGGFSWVTELDYATGGSAGTSSASQVYAYGMLLGLTVTQNSTGGYTISGVFGAEQTPRTLSDQSFGPTTNITVQGRRSGWRELID